ncbi:MAG: tRNA (N6-isopentenyl adenosine(37)-C2)-methylthiotransferase MiaB [Deltaproteobacteria bacterium]|nr:tRNA (N6-isopentenyl adenosine(37)-C2)-methylthiotransferase MiaB [Deltaproteobacteria bacterium]
MNEHDSRKIILILKELGFESTDEPENAQLILFNTCTIREKAHHKAISQIGRTTIYKERDPNTIIGVCGCVAQQDKESLFDKYPHLDLVFGPDQINKLPELLDHAQRKKRGLSVELVNTPEEYTFLDQLPEEVAPASSSFVSIMKGCNCACSYCIVPSVRGKEVCRSPEEIVAEIDQLAKLGNREAVLLGQNVNAYHSKRSNSSTKDVTFAKLIRLISDETGIDRIRFTSPHPKDVGEDLILEYGQNEKLCPHIHLPLQSGANETLKRMRRGYTRERYIEIVRGLRKASPDISITTDLIVGFCGESDADFQMTFELMEEVEFDSIFAFKYSPRPGTFAYEQLPDDVEKVVKEERLEKILALQRLISMKKNEALIGKDVEALVYSLDRMNRGLLTGRMPDNRIIHFSGNPDLIGDIVPVRVTAAHKNSLAGEMIG